MADQTPAPTNAPTSVGGGGSFACFACFSGNVFVHKINTGIVKMSDLQVGNLVLGGGNDKKLVYKCVYSFGQHCDESVMVVDFIQLLPSKLELSQDQMVIVVNMHN